MSRRPNIRRISSIARHCYAPDIIADTDCNPKIVFCISAVVIHPAGKEDPKIEVMGRLAQLTSAPARNVRSSAQRQEDQLARIIHGGVGFWEVSGD